jgi:fatty-acyl-CoA synthase
MHSVNAAVSDAGTLRSQHASGAPSQGRMSFGYFDWIDHYARRRGEKIAIEDLASERKFTFSELALRINSLGRLLMDTLCASHGDRVCLLAKSCPEAFELQFACAKAGTIFVPLNWRLAARELQYILRDAEPLCLFYEPEFSDVAAALLAGSPIKGVRLGSESSDDYEALIERHPSGVFTRPTIDMEETWSILYTSGTTGSPKGVMLSYRMVTANAFNFSIPTRIGTDSKFLCAMPTFHTGGLNVYANPVLHSGGTVVIMRDFDPSVALAQMSSADAGITHFFGTPSHYIFMSELPEFDEVAFPTLVNAGMGGAPPSAGLIERWLSKNIPLQPTYGMTEIGPGILTTELGRVREKIGTAGTPSLHMEFKVADPATGRECNAGEVGEIWVRGPGVMSGYWRQPDTTAQSFHDGWFKSGDAAYRDEEGFVFIVDRLKEMFISGGENVYPAEIEKVLSTLPGVSMVAVVGVPDARWGEVGQAFIVLKQGQALTAQQAAAACRAALAKYKVPKLFTFVESLPQTSSGKVQRSALKQRAAAAIQ